MQQRLAVLCAVLALGFTACSKQDDAARAGGPPPAEVAVVTAARGDSAVTREFPGRVTAYRTAEVRAQVEGILQQRRYAEGSEVRAGQQLFQIDPRTLRANLAAASAELARAQASAEIAAATVKRYGQLVGDQGVSRQEYDQAQSTLKQAQAQVLAASAAVDRARIDLEHASVSAPISGRIGRALVSEGALVGKGEATHLATIEQLDPIYVDFNQSANDLLRLRQQLKSGKLNAADGLPVELILPDGSAYPHAGKLLFSEQTVDPATGTIVVRAQFPNPDRLLMPGVYVTARSAQGTLSGAVRVPQRAVQSSPQGQFVYVVDKDGKVAQQPVKTAGFSGKDWLIGEGLEGGETVIVEGIQKIRPGAPVKPVPYGASQVSSQSASQVTSQSASQVTSQSASQATGQGAGQVASQPAAAASAVPAKR
ncbi:efflux RND transporter periplasmic adaptor subunit [Jeongeupia sp. USM3]|uniref:efflux RND transporter periplasmic adaptor subunit n=1 Tax=Jeongeupia sp. USM3 TaxID=1906741 RepID=UPI00089DDF3A|nr:efflux RND transporter periplasmic adaptor subunit [Jeongeupia sp. USM3]AOX99447.1 efflux transporter periplasmic adaptor subunit [Jeongeupia sp. USM3]